MKLNAQELRTADEEEIKLKLTSLKRHPIYFILENIYDTYNIGGLFRLADALSITKMYICGQSEIPPNAKIKKASISTYKIVPWEYKKTAAEAIIDLKSSVVSRQSLVKDKPLIQEPTTIDQRHSVQIVAIEQDAKSVPYTEIEYHSSVALLVGNETSGVLPETLALCDHIAEIPMWGINRSLNVIVSAAIVSYHAMGKLMSNDK